MRRVIVHHPSQGSSLHRDAAGHAIAPFEAPASAPAAPRDGVVKWPIHILNDAGTMAIARICEGCDKLNRRCCGGGGACEALPGEKNKRRLYDVIVRSAAGDNACPLMKHILQSGSGGTNEPG